MPVLNHPRANHNFGWSCDRPGCRSCGAGYPSHRAARAAEARHRASARHPAP